MIAHRGTQTILTKRLKLRRFTPDDAQQVFTNWANDKEVTKYLRWVAHKDVSQTRRLLEAWEREYASDKTYIWGLENRETGALMGSIAATVADLDLCADVGYCLGQSFWGQGYATEALSGILRFLFIDLGLNRVEAYHSINNPASGSVLRKAGMRFEGRARQKYLCSMGFQDSDMYAILRSDIERLGEF